VPTAKRRRFTAKDVAELMSCLEDYHAQVWDKRIEEHLKTGHLRKSVSSETFSVGSMSHADYVYDAATNADRDNDSDGMTITVSKP
jgi:hypothetical protein